ncbi:MAG: glycosyltransferase, partial [Actinomycetia bacterium]|nr:glycosyltransferase [Actinomycetes bacterium]
GPPLYDACYLGRFHPSKGILDLVSIWRSVCDRRPGSTLAVIGTGRQSVVDKFAREVQVNHLDDVITIYGYLPRDEADRVLSSSKTFLLPSREEGFGISLLEAMSYGVPPVAYGLTHFGDIFGEALTTAPIGNVQEFAEKALELLEDEALREKKATVSREFAAGFSWEIVAPREVEAIASAIHSAESLQATGEGSSKDDNRR